MPGKPRLALQLVAQLVLATTLVAGAVLIANPPVLTSLSFREDFSSGKLDRWQFQHPEDWVILTEGPRYFLHMLRSREPGVPRRPMQFALLRDARVGSFDLRTQVRREKEAMMIVFNYVDDLHFYYAHLAEHPGTDEIMHNGIFIVNGEPRKRIPPLPPLPALPDKAWHSVRVHRDVPSGLIEVYVDGSAKPYFSTEDRTFTCGQIGLGSFDETGDFTDVELESSDANCRSNTLTRPASLN
jgi:hypothetical protein